MPDVLSSGGATETAATPDGALASPAAAAPLVSLLQEPVWAARGDELLRLLTAAGTDLDRVLVEIDRRGLFDRLLPSSASPTAAALVTLIVDGARSHAAALAVAAAAIRRSSEYDRLTVNHWVARADQDQTLSSLFAELIERGLYPALATLLTADGTADSTPLRALAAARPDYDAPRRNAAALAAAASGAATAGKSFPFDALILPGFTPRDAKTPLSLHQIRAAMERVALAYRDFLAGTAPLIIVSGGCVYPPGTPYNEAAMMADQLIAKNVPADRILLDPWARHSTTNLRNAGRLMLQQNLRRGLVVTGFDNDFYLASQAFYFGSPTLSTFDDRCRRELGYPVGDLEAVDEHHVRFTPSQEVTTPNFRDPLDA